MQSVGNMNFFSYLCIVKQKQKKGNSMNENNLHSRLNKINTLAHQRVVEEELKKQKAEADFYATCKKAKALAPRIAELLKVAKALCDNNFPLGEDKYRNLETIPEFIANGYSELGIVCIMFGKTHRGQIVNSDIVRGIGFTRCGGNSSSIYINADGELLVWGSGKPFDYHLRFGRIVDLFEEFETKFYEYVDSL